MPQTRSRHGITARGWWLALGLIWLIATLADRLWLGMDQRLPAWDQADYLNSAVDHGRALGLLPGGGWQGWAALLDLSPKIPPLASLINGTVMGLAGQEPVAASWSLAFWHGLLLLAVALWSRELVGGGFALLAAALVILAPALAELRVDYTLDLPLTASCTLALWLLGRWRAPSPAGGRARQAIAAALAVAAAILVKQSALLVVALPSLWAALRGLSQRGRRAQVILALALVLGLILPWLQHNWITTLGGTNRAVIESAAAEGDPDPFSLASLLWYPLRLSSQLGPVTLVGGLAGLVTSLLTTQSGRIKTWSLRSLATAQLPDGWAWLVGCSLAGWLATSLSPNKDARYFAPVLPLLLMMLALGWWRLFLVLRHRCGEVGARTGLGVGLLAAALNTGAARAAAIQAGEGFPLPAAIAELRSRVGDQPVTLLMMASQPDLNDHTATVYGRLKGGRLIARQVGRNPGTQTAVLDAAEWLLLATGDQGSRRPSARELSRSVRQDNRFERVRSWPRAKGQDLELWRRRPDAPEPARFDESFMGMARRMEEGPAALEPLFGSIGLQHQLDGHLLYQKRVEKWARQRLQSQPDDRKALWSMALLATLQNRPEQAQAWYERLQKALPGNPWPASYRAVVLLAGWQPWRAYAALKELPDSAAKSPVIDGLLDLSGLLSGDLRRAPSLGRSLPAAVAEVTAQLAKKP
jgi:4-amino-4-deoxy-L-arabinose transferase-like glycosyltransferase